RRSAKISSVASRQRLRRAWNDVGRFERRGPARNTIGHTARHTVQVGAVLDRYTGDFYCDCRCCRSSKLAHAGGFDGFWRALETLGEKSLHKIAKCPTQSKKRRLRAVPGNQAIGI